MALSTHAAGAELLFFANKKLQGAGRPVFVTGEVQDAQAIEEAGGIAVALGNSASIGRFIAQLEIQKPGRTLILALFDKGGNAYWQGVEERLAPKLGMLGISYCSAQPWERDWGADDLAAWAMFAEDAALQFVKLHESGERAAHKHARGAEHIENFIKVIGESVDTPSIPTGFSELDIALDGGLHEGLYVIGAITALGKTTLALQIADQIAAAKAAGMAEGADVLIFSLEMARSELMAKSISRQTLLAATDKGQASTAREVTAGKKYKGYCDAKLSLISRAVDAYSEYAKHIYYFEGVGDMGAAQIRATVERHIRYTGNRPVVVVDYLQIIAPHSERATDKQNTDKAVLELKRMSRDHKIPVIAISSFNRENYETAVSLRAFKESGAVEYSSDVLIGLEFKGAGKDFDVAAAMAKYPREVELVILKNRNGAAGGRILYKYYPKFNRFKEA
jgi:replicative DNA helicase